MTTNVDVAIIGTGPGGGMAACRLAGSGLSVVVIEKETLPRRKPCGGGIPSQAAKMFDWDITPYVEAQIHTIKTLFKHELPVDRTRERPLLMVDRSRFDQHLIDRAVAMGHGQVTLRERFEVRDVAEDATGVTITDKHGERIHASYLIAADGAFSRTAACLGLRPTKAPAVAIDAEIEVESDVFEAEAGRATINFFCLPNGYGWIFPKNGLLSCGVGSWGGKPQLQVSLNEFLAASFPPGSIRSVERYGFPIPIYSEHRKVATPRVCLVGDAAGLVDPIMGEGIRFALQSGALAANVVANQLQATLDRVDIDDLPSPGESDARVYQQLVDERIGRDFAALSLFITPLYLQRPQYFYDRFFIKGESYYSFARAMMSAMKGAPAGRDTVAREVRPTSFV
jgi:geranylgeranyl reductase family protein